MKDKPGIDNKSVEHFINYTQQTNTCTNSTVKILEKVVKYSQS